jgi:hypothetical protein
MLGSPQSRLLGQSAPTPFRLLAQSAPTPSRLLRRFGSSPIGSHARVGSYAQSAPTPFGSYARVGSSPIGLRAQWAPGPTQVHGGEPLPLNGLIDLSTGGQEFLRLLTHLRLDQILGALTR